jgi:hypothetical protein
MSVGNGVGTPSVLCDAVTSARSKQVGALDVLDLDVICEFHGQRFLPYPFGYTKPSRFASADDASAYTTTVPDRLNYGDLAVFGEFVQAYTDADISVECRVQYIPADKPSVRVMACRAGHFGFIATQRPDADVIDVSSVSPYELGAAICDAVSFTDPGQHRRIVIPEYVPRPRHGSHTEDIVVRDWETSRSETSIPARDVTAYAMVQSHWRPAQRWGMDRGKRAVVWVRTAGDGDYVYTPDYSYARPMTKDGLNEQIDRLIADDVAILRELRRG